MKEIYEILNWLNKYEGLAQWIMATSAVIALIYAIKEFFLKRRPYIDVEIQVAKNPDKTKGGWLFFALLTNKGIYPGRVKIRKTEMRVGDESYPSSVKSKLLISPGESKKSALIGSIYESGIKKIRGHEYRLNRAEIEIEIDSADIGSDKFKYKLKLYIRLMLLGNFQSFY